MWYKSLGVAVAVSLLSSCSDEIIGTVSKESGEQKEQKQSCFFDRNSVDYSRIVHNYAEIPVKVVSENIDSAQWSVMWADRSHMDFDKDEQKIRLNFTENDIGKWSKKLYLYQKESSPVDSIEISLTVEDSLVDLFQYTVGNEWIFEGSDYGGSVYGVRIAQFFDTSSVIAVSPDSATIKRVRTIITKTTGEILDYSEAKPLDTLYEIDTVSFPIDRSMLFESRNYKSLLEFHRGYEGDLSLEFYEHNNEQILLKNNIGLVSYSYYKSLGDMGDHEGYYVQLKSFNGAAITTPELD